MNFFRNSFSSITEPPAVRNDSDRDASAGPPPAPPIVPVPPPPVSSDSDSEDSRFPPPLPPSAMDSLRTRNRVAIEDHVDITPKKGGILVPCKELPKDWEVARDLTSLMTLDREFVFPGERVSIVVYASSDDDTSLPELITPFKVAAMMDKAKLAKEKRQGERGNTSGHDVEQSSQKEQQASTDEDVASPSLLNSYPSNETLLRLEGHKKRTTALLQLFQNSHFFTRISGLDEQTWTNQGDSGDSAEELDDGANASEQEKSSEPDPVLIEGKEFDPQRAGGVARDAKCYSFENGDIAVVLQITIGTDVKKDATLEVLQFERTQELCGKHMSGISTTWQTNSNTADDLLLWLLPLDNPPQLPLTMVHTASASFVSNSPQKPSTTGASGSTLFSFANLRSYSISSQSSQSSFTPASSLMSSNGSDELERSLGPKTSKVHSSSNEGLIAFRGVQLEPQRFSVHCGLEGLYVPGRRWRRKLQIIEPVAIQSYFADCNTKDLICVSVENIVTSHLPEIVVTIDSISIVCQTADPNFVPSSVPISCIEVGENHELPGLSLRPGEQHSFVLKPQNCLLHSTENRSPRIGNLHKKKDSKQGSSQTLGNYVVIVSCRCSHTASRLHFKHPIGWQPRPPRDLLLSVSLEPTPEPTTQSGLFPSLQPKVVTVQATNLTSESLHLTLLAPSSKFSGSSQGPAIASSGLTRISSLMSFSGRKEWTATKSNKNESNSSNARSSSLQRSLSLPPVRPIESIMGITPRVVKERTISAADIAAENNSARTHLWLQSVVPLGSVPPQSTTAIRCELLPLTDGIITLDTLHISSKEQDVYYPERPVQIYATSSIGIGIP